MQQIECIHLEPDNALIQPQDMFKKTKQICCHKLKTMKNSRRRIHQVVLRHIVITTKQAQIKHEYLDSQAESTTEMRNISKRHMDKT